MPQWVQQQVPIKVNHHDEAEGWLWLQNPLKINDVPNLWASINPVWFGGVHIFSSRILFQWPSLLSWTLWEADHCSTILRMQNFSSKSTLYYYQCSMIHRSSISWDGRMPRLLKWSAGHSLTLVMKLSRASSKNGLQMSPIIISWQGPDFWQGPTWLHWGKPGRKRSMCVRVKSGAFLPTVAIAWS